MKITKQIKIRDVLVGGGAPIAVQSMTNTDTRDAKATLAQIRALADAGCDIVRCAVPDMQAAEALREICAARRCRWSRTFILTTVSRWRRSSPAWIRFA